MTRPSPARLALFRTIALLLPFVLLVLIELLLRGIDYGRDYTLFVEAPDQSDYWVMNPNVSEKYFTATENATRGNQELFTKQKDSTTYRIFVLGASTALGYPYLHNGSFHRWLRYRLMHTMPDTNVEIINLSLTAVTSYTLLDMARQLTNYQPDAVLIYAGHNEYYGTLGVGSTSRLGGDPTLGRAMIWLRDFRLMQLISNVMTSLKRRLADHPTDLRTNLMRRLAAEQRIPYGSELYRRGLTQYETNLNDLLAHLNERQVPVFLSNLVSNEKDLSPFLNDTTEEGGSAMVQYRRAERAYAEGLFTEAKAQYVRAKDLDLLRFRAPTALDSIIEHLTDRYAHVHRVDAQASFASYSPRGIFGQETLLEHVHPNLTGYALLSEAFYQALRRERFVEPTEPAWSGEELRRQMPVTTVDSLRGAYETMILKEGWPFNEPMPPMENREKTVEETLAGQLVVQQISWDEAMQQLLRHYVQSDQRLKATRVAEALVLEHPYRGPLYQQAGKLSLLAGEDAKGLRYLQRGFTLQPTLATAQALFVALLTRDRPEEALPYLDYAAQQERKYTELQRFTNDIVRMKATYAQDTTRSELLTQIAATYLRFANTTAARRYVDRALLATPGDSLALRLKTQLNHSR